MSGIRKRKCRHCGKYFIPDCRNVKRQKYCGRPECLKASKRESQRRWLGKPENRDYFRSPENVKRVREWRKGKSRVLAPRRCVTRFLPEECERKSVGYNRFRFAGISCAARFLVLATPCFHRACRTTCRFRVTRRHGKGVSKYGTIGLGHSQQPDCRQRRQKW
jgi:hypothetical protein